MTDRQEQESNTFDVPGSQGTLERTITMSKRILQLVRYHIKKGNFN